MSTTITSVRSRTATPIPLPYDVQGQTEVWESLKRLSPRAYEAAVAMIERRAGGR